MHLATQAAVAHPYILGHFLDVMLERGQLRLIVERERRLKYMNWGMMMAVGYLK